MNVMTKLREWLHLPPAKPEPVFKPWDDERERRLTREADALEELAEAIRKREDDNAPG